MHLYSIITRAFLDMLLADVAGRYDGIMISVTRQVGQFLKQIRQQFFLLKISEIFGNFSDSFEKFHGLSKTALATFGQLLGKMAPFYSKHLVTLNS